VEYQAISIEIPNKAQAGVSTINRLPSLPSSPLPSSSQLPSSSTLLLGQQ